MRLFILCVAYSGGYAPVYTLRCLQCRVCACLYFALLTVSGMSLFILCVAYSGGYGPVYTLRCLQWRV